MSSRFILPRSSGSASFETPSRIARPTSTIAQAQSMRGLNAESGHGAEFLHANQSLPRNSPSGRSLMRGR